ncbi:hypothetical protein Micbo1qcDRAFT_175781 [Microdochium bolleyi]|uniref:BTB domain-containing protein n=1 Tax=Microdochium bolleyi TaxID=196109 RepID=A0A136J3A6_9PEZI|nr:hypothetical protein Micbo1qcDRAFT_175781 [Microdochium bolleyi]
MSTLPLPRCLPELIEYCVCASCTQRHVRPLAQQSESIPCSTAAAQMKHARDFAVLITKDSRTVHVEFRNPTLPGEGRTLAVHVVILAYFSRVVKRMVHDFLTGQNRRLVSVISFEDEILEEDDVELLVEWCYTGGLASLAKAYIEPPDPVQDDNDNDSEESDDEPGNVQTAAKRKSKRKSKAKAKKRKARKPAQNSDCDLRQIPKFAARDTVERLYCIAADLEMPEFANYCMSLIMAKYSWNFFSFHPTNCRTRSVETPSDIERSRKKQNAQPRPKAANTTSTSNNTAGHGGNTDDGDDNDESSEDESEEEAARKQRQQRSKGPFKAKKAFTLAHPSSTVPFNLMLHDAPYAPHGLCFVVRKCDADNKMRRHLRNYMRAVFCQRNHLKSIDYVDDRTGFIRMWQDHVRSDDVFEQWFKAHLAVSMELDRHEERVAASRLLDWPIYMVNTNNDDKSRPQQAAASSSPSAAAPTTGRDPNLFWLELEKLRIKDVLVEEHVDARPLRTAAEPSRAVMKWTEHCQDNIAISRQITTMVVREMYAEKRNLKKFRFGDY